jgi:hypothetical protein
MYIEKVDRVAIPNQTVSTPSNPNDAVSEMNKRMESLNTPHNTPSTSYNRYNVLDQLSPTNRPASPSGSTDSSETITPSNFK